MIGNDVVDLQLAKIESNWQRKGFLDKIFTKNEQIFIQTSRNQETTVWNLWSRKEAAYKIWNRKTGIRKYNPIQFECQDLDLKVGKVFFKTEIFYVKTTINVDYIHTIAVSNINVFNEIKSLDSSITVQKQYNIPFYINQIGEIKPISKSQHGQFSFGICL